MDGASLIPYPVGLNKSQSNKNDCITTLFFNEEFSASWGAQTVSLTFLPLPHSEHVYLWRGGQGTDQSEGTTWTRDAGSLTVNVLTQMGAQPGDKIVVEYAYYDQAPAAAETYGCIDPPMRYPIVKLPDADTIMLIGSDTGAHPERMTYAPTADGMVPSSLTTVGAPQFGGFASNDNETSGPEYQLHVGPSIAPGYAHSWEAGPVSFKTQHSHVLSLYGGATEPRFHTATYLRYSLWAQLINYKKALPTDPTGGASHDIEMILDTTYLAYFMTYNPHTSTWTVGASAYQWEGPDGDVSSVATGITVNPYDLAPHRYEIAMDATSATATFTVDSQPWSITDASLWPHGEECENYPMTPEYLRGRNPSITGGFFAGSFGSLGGQYAILRTAGSTVETDAVWCVWTTA